MASSEAFLPADAGAWTSPEPGVTRRVMVHRDDMMMVEVVFEKGAVGSLHHHPHVQCAYVADGRFAVTIDGVTRELSRGGSDIVAPDLVHGVVALEAGRLIDIFTPARSEFL